MKALKITGIQKLDLIEVQKPKPDGENVIVKITAVGICGSDIHYWDMGRPYILGHEHAGVVDDPGNRTDLKKGDRVTTIPLRSSCYKCELCLQGRYELCKNIIPGPGITAITDGSYAEYMLARPERVRKIPESLSDEEVTMIEPAATPYSAVKDLNIRKGDRVLVMGGGIIGSFAAAWSKYFGADYIAMCELNSFRAQKNLKDGYVDEIFDAKSPDLIQDLIKASGGEGFDYCLECVGNGIALDTCVKAAKMRAKVAVIGVCYTDVLFSMLLTLTKRLTIKGYLGYSAAEFDEVLDLAAKKKINLMTQYSATIGLEQAQDAFKKLKDPKSKYVKILINPQK